MKTSLFISFILLLFIFSSKAQDIQFPPSILAAGGGGSGSTHISKWRIGQVNVLHIKSKDLKSSSLTASAEINDLNDDKWKISAYPNPVTKYLQIQFDIDKSKLFGINVTDISGRVIIDRKAQLVIPKEVVQLDLAGFSPALYIVNIWSKDKTINKIIKVSKQ